MAVWTGVRLPAPPPNEKWVEPSVRLIFYLVGAGLPRSKHQKKDKLNLVRLVFFICNAHFGRITYKCKQTSKLSKFACIWWRCRESDGRKSKQSGELFARPGRASADLYKVVRTIIKMCACDVRGSSIGQAGRLPSKENFLFGWCGTTAAFHRIERILILYNSINYTYDWQSVQNCRIIELR